MKNYKNLKNKTFLDFTNDPEIIKQILDVLSADYFLSSVSEMGRFTTFYKFAKFTNNDELLREVERQFEYIFNE